MSYNQPPRAPSSLIHPPPYGFGLPPMMHPGLPPQPQIIRPPNTTTMAATSGDAEQQRAPSTTVFVGNISERVPDPMIRSMLQRCGTVISWKRAQGANGKLQAFGFCEYDLPEATLRCIRLLNDYEIAGKKIVVKVDQKTKELLIDYKKKKRREMEANKQKKPTLSSTQQQLMRFNLTKRKYGDLNEAKEEEEQEQQNRLKKLDDLQISLESVDEDSLKEDRITINAFESILKQYSKDLIPLPPQPPTQQQTSSIPLPTTNPVIISAPPVINTQLLSENNQTNDTEDSSDNNSSGVYMKPHLRLEEIQLDADKKEIITSEIQLFREKHKGEDVKIKKEEKERMERVIEREKQREKRSKSRDRDRDRDSRRDRDRERDREHRNNNNNNNTSSSRRSASRSPKSPKVVTRSPPPPRNRPPRVVERSSPPVTSNNTNPDDLEELNERKRLERKLREKEAAYRERLKQWESREDKRHRQYEIEKKNEINKRKDRLKEGKKLKQILEDYEDEKDDVNYYKGNNLAKKLKFREKEIEMDNRDRQREKEEIDLLKEKIVNQGGSLSDLEAEIKRIQEDENNKMRIKYDNDVRSSSSESSSESTDISESEGEMMEEVSVKKNEYDVENVREEEEEEEEVEEILDKKEEVSAKPYNGDYDDGYKYKSYFDKDRYQQSYSNDMDIDDNESSSKEDNNNENSQNSVIINEKAKTLSLNTEINLKKDLLSPSMMSDESTTSNQGGQEQQQQQEERVEEKDYEQQNPTYDLSPAHSQTSSSMNHEESPLYSYALNPTSSLLQPSSQPKTVTIKKQMSKTKQPTSIKPINQVFVEDDEDEESNSQQNKRLRLTQLQLNELEKKQRQQLFAASILTPEERKKAVKKLVESIPTDREELFNFNIDWDQLDQNLMDKRIKPWVSKKIVEYIGEEEETLNEFICSKILVRVKPDKILDDVKVILDDEAELFVKKMWRLIVYETESKRLGLSK